MICFFCVTFVFIPEVSKAVNAHSPRGGHGVLRAFQYPVILGSHNNGALVLTSITDVIFFDLPGVYCRSLISSWRNKRKEIVLGRKEGKREARNPNLSEERTSCERTYSIRNHAYLVIVYIVLQAFRHSKSTAKISRKLTPCPAFQRT